jgi:hypothetical protein
MGETSLKVHKVNNAAYHKPFDDKSQAVREKKVYKMNNVK